MADLIYEHTNVFLHSLLCGFCIWFLYDVLLMLRKTVKHNAIWMGMEDILFWILSACSIFSMLYTYNYGSLRGYVFLGVLLGILLHGFCVTKPLLSLYVLLLEKMKIILQNSMKLLSKMQKKD
ncbi:MAG: spore cortex biosynthesis protein YabQ [Lachnospiraceae bacterium]|nr:spore cortex biosynthesis protein YabQ [Lachnospiraceae bacterium]